MFNVTKFFAGGLKNTILMRNGSAFSYNGPTSQIYTDTQVARWHNGEFSSAEFTISIDFDTNNKEIIKCLVCNGPDTASITIYGINNLGNNLADLSVSVNDSYVDLIINPSSTTYNGAKFIYSANYYYNQNPLIK